MVAIILSALIAFKIFNFKGPLAYMSLKMIFIIILNTISLDVFCSFINLGYESILLEGTGAPTMLLMIYMLIMGSIFIPVELSNLQEAIDMKSSKESEWLFATRLILACFNLMLWLLFLVMAKAKK